MNNVFMYMLFLLSADIRKRFFMEWKYPHNNLQYRYKNQIGTYIYLHYDLKMEILYIVLNIIVRQN